MNSDSAPEVDAATEEEVEAWLAMRLPSEPPIAEWIRRRLHANASAILKKHAPELQLRWTPSDASQAACTRVFPPLSQFHGRIAEFTAWLYTVQENVVFDEKKKWATAKRADKTEPIIDDALTDDASSPSEHFTRRELPSKLIDVLLGMDPVDVKIVWLRLEKVTWEKLSEATDLTVSQLRTRYSKASQELREAQDESI